jgi:glycosyltransferase involved in cell wall biosynthesis
MTREIASRLGRAGAEVLALAVSAPPALSYPRPPAQEQYLGREFDSALAADNVQVIRIPPNPYHWSLDGLGVRRALGEVFAGKPVDLALSYYHEGAFLQEFLHRRGARFGYIATWISYKLALERPVKKAFLREQMRRWIDRRLIIKPHRAADVIFATSHFTRGELVEAVGVQPERVRVCPLGVSPDFLRIPRRPGGRVCRLLFFGRVVHIKGVQDCMEALGKLAARGVTGWTFRMFGQGNHAWAKRLAAENGIAGKVEIAAELGDADLRRELEAADLAFMPSHVEAFGLSNAEAQASGLPLVGYAAGSVPEIVADGETGWLAPFRNVERLADCLQYAIEHPEEAHRAGLAGRERVRRNFTWEQTAATILAALGEETA